MLNDLRFALRSLRSAPGFTAVAVAVLALGIGATTSVFSVLDAVLLRPLPYDDPGNLAWFYESNPERGWDRAEVAPANFLDWREQLESFSALGAMQDWTTEQTLLEGGEARRITVLGVTGNLFDVLGVAPRLGRSFREEETWAGHDAVVMLSYGFWQRAYGGDPGIVGRTVQLDGVSREVVGVMPASFRTPDLIWMSATSLAGPVDAWIPLGWRDQDRTAVFFRRAHIIQAIGRLRPGSTLARAREELRGVAARLAAAYPETNAGMGAGLERLQASVVGHARTPLVVVMGAVALLLLIACANVANLLLMRSLGRGRQMAVRAALGASRGALFRHALGEAVVLAAAGGVLGLLVASWGTDLLTRLAPASMPRMQDVTLSGPVLVFSLVTTLATGAIFGVLPALRSARAELGQALRTRTGAGGRSSRSRAVLVTVEVALAVVLAGTAGLLVRTVDALSSVDAGFRAEDRLAVEVDLSPGSYPGITEIFAFYRQLLARAADLPGVESAALTRSLPLEGGWSSSFSVAGWDADHARGDILHREVSPGFFTTLGTPILAGRTFASTDDVDAPLVVVVNRTFADRYLPDGAVGRRISFDEAPDSSSFWYDVVGVVGDQKQNSLRADARPEVFGSIYQSGGRGRTLVLHTRMTPAAATAAVRALVRELDPSLPVGRVITVHSVVDRAMSGERYLLGLLTTFALAALLLALLGVYGVTAQSVRERTRELGIRAALGADPASLLRGVLVRGMGPVLLGIAVGVLAALPAASLLRSTVFGTTTTDPATFAATALLLAASGLAASLVPALRTRRIEPMRVLRNLS